MMMLQHKNAVTGKYRLKHLQIVLWRYYYEKGLSNLDAFKEIGSVDDEEKVTKSNVSECFHHFYQDDFSF